jgi:G3E family GTPase
VQVASWVHALAPRAPLRDGTTDAHAAWLEELLADPPLDRPAPAQPGHVHDEHCGHLHHGIASAWVPVPDGIDLEELEDQLAELPAEVVRVKGIVHGDDPRTGAAGWFAVHRVGLRVSSEPIATPELAEGRLVALGTAVDPGMLQSCVDRAHA